ncbi:MAG: chaperonin GroEL [Chloroflexota bacterium]|nr:chaperonin GroEL [Chloroflexota bacterium]
MPRGKPQRVVFQPNTYRGFQRGANQIVNAVRPTLGPRSRTVVIQRELDDKTPEMLDDGGTIVKRIIALADRDEDVGAMFVREMLWRLHDEVGDGTAAAAVLFQSIYNQGIRYLASGGNARILEKHLTEGLQIILDQLGGMTEPVSGKQQLAHLAETICYDPAMARLLGEIFDIIGEFGRLEIRKGRTRDMRREYVEGMYWERGLMSRQMITDHARTRSELQNPHILISDLQIDDPAQLLPLLEMAKRENIKGLLIVAGKISDNALSILLANRQEEGFQPVAVTTPGYGVEAQLWALEDLAILTGGRSFIQVAGDTFDGVQPEDLGNARRAWADLKNFGIIGGGGGARALRNHIATVRASYDNTKNLVLVDKLRERIGKLLGGSATLWVGANTELEVDFRKAVADRTAAAMRTAMLDGIVPGGGVALLACRPALRERLQQSESVDERAAFQILIKALEAPIRAILQNAGLDASDVMADIRLAGNGYGFDVTTETVVNMKEAGIVDATAVQKAAVFSAVSGAALALTVDVIVHHRQPERQIKREPATRKRL